MSSYGKDPDGPCTGPSPDCKVKRHHAEGERVVQEAPTPTTKFFIDTEFIESGSCHPLELLSIGIVCEDGREFYAVNAEADLIHANDWVKANVLPHLGLPRTNLLAMRDHILQFVGVGKPEFWGYYADYDWVVFCQIFGAMIDLPRGWPMYCRDIKQFCDSLGNPKLPEQTSTEHNALNDARWNREAYNFLAQATLRDSQDWRKMCIVEIAAENPSVADYVQHWEGRAERAEAALKKHEATEPTVLREAATPNKVVETLRRHLRNCLNYLSLDRGGHAHSADGSPSCTGCCIVAEVEKALADSSALSSAEKETDNE